MPKPDYTNSELWVKDKLDHLFWIEIAKRKERQENGDAYTALVQLCHDLSAFFENFNEKIEFPYENGPDDFFDLIQFGLAVEEVVTDSERADLLQRALKQFDGLALDLMNRLHYYRGFRLADYSEVTDLKALHSWWAWISTKEGRNSLGTSGRFSDQGDPRPVPATDELWFVGDNSPTIKTGDLVQTVYFSPIPVRIPRPIMAGQVWSYSSDDHDIVVDGHQLQDRIVLEFDLLKPLPSMRQVELALRSAHALTRSQRDWALLEKGIVPDGFLAGAERDNDVDYKQLMLRPLEEHKLVTGQNIVCPLIFGLYCWDLVATGLKDAQASRCAHETLLNATGQPYYTARKALYGLTDVIRPKVNFYASEQIPWNN